MCKPSNLPTCHVIPPDDQTLISTMRLKYLQQSDETLERILNTHVLPLLWSRGFSLIRTPTDPLTEDNVEPILSIGPSGIHGPYQEEL